MNEPKEIKEQYTNSKFSAKQWFCLNAMTKIQRLKAQTYPKKEGQK